MMKRLIGIFLFLCLLFSLTGCAGLRQPEPTEPLPEKVWVDYSYGCCRITNAEGQKIVFGIDDEQTDMEVFNTQVAEDTPVIWREEVPYSAFFTLEAPGASREYAHEFYISADNYWAGASGYGIKEASIDLRAGKIRVAGENMELSIIVDALQSIHPLIEISGTALEEVVVECCEKGAVVSGLTGEGKVTVLDDDDYETTYTFTGEAVEIDVVSQPGEILITPVPNTFSS